MYPPPPGGVGGGNACILLSSYDNVSSSSRRRWWRPTRWAAGLTAERALRASLTLVALAAMSSCASLCAEAGSTTIHTHTHTHTHTYTHTHIHTHTHTHTPARMQVRQQHARTQFFTLSHPLLRRRRRRHGCRGSSRYPPPPHMAQTERCRSTGVHMHVPSSSYDMHVSSSSSYDRSRRSDTI